MTRTSLIGLSVGGVILLAAVGGGVWYLRSRSTAYLAPTTTTNTSTQSASNIDPSLDTDGDGLTDVEEAQLGTDPTKVDTDGNGFSDYEDTRGSRVADVPSEVFFVPSDPNQELIARLTQASGTSTSPQEPEPVSEPEALPVGAMDEDNDGLTRDQELQLGTDAQDADTDDDGLNDGDEVKKYRTNPTVKDTDNDTFGDGEEVRNGYNPLGAGKCPTTDCIL